MLTVIPGGAREKRSYKPTDGHYLDAQMRLISKIFEQYGDSYMQEIMNHTEELRKLVYMSVKAVGCIRGKELDNYGEFFISNVFTQIDWILGLIGKMTPRQIIQIFPIAKIYDGERWQCKDYFTTMKKVREIGLDNVIGEEQAPRFLWSYMNPDIDEFMVVFMLTISRMRVLQGGKDIMEEFFEEQGVPTYSYDEQSGTLTNRQTGEVSKVEKPKTRVPKYMKVVEGGLN